MEDQANKENLTDRVEKLEIILTSLIKSFPTEAHAFFERIKTNTSTMSAGAAKEYINKLLTI